VIPLRSREDRRVVEEAHDNPEWFEERLGLFVGGEDWTHALRNARWGQEGLPIDLVATLAEDLPDRLDGAPVELFTEVEGIPIPQVPRGKSGLFPGESYGLTELLAASPGAYANGDDAITLGELTEYLGETPDRIGLHAARLLPYDRSQIEMQTLDSPALTMAGSGDSPAFTAEEVVGDVFSRLTDAVGYEFRDTAHRGVRGFVPFPLARGQEITRRYSFADIPDWKRPRRQEARHHSVRVYRHNDDGTLAFESVEEIPYVGLAHPPLPGQVLNILLEDEEGEGSADARKRAMAEALELGRGWYEGDVTLPRYHALVAADDRITVHERRASQDPAGVEELLWLLRVESYEHNVDPPGEGSSGGSADSSGGASSPVFGTRIGYTAVVVERSRVDVPNLIVPRAPTRGVLPAIPEE
jgi:hypothetical protein